MYRNLNYQNARLLTIFALKLNMQTIAGASSS